MEFLVSAGLLAAVLGWLLGVYRRVEELRRGVESARALWLADTRRRNDCLGDFEAVFTPLSGEGNAALLELLEASRLALTAEQAPFPEAAEGEPRLRRCLRGALSEAEHCEHLRRHERLQVLGGHLRTAMYRQEQSERLLSRAARLYNLALEEPPMRLLRHALGFEPCVLPLWLQRDRPPPDGRAGGR